VGKLENQIFESMFNLLKIIQKNKILLVEQKAIYLLISFQNKNKILKVSQTPGNPRNPSQTTQKRAEQAKRQGSPSRAKKFEKTFYLLFVFALSFSPPGLLTLSI
jgi:hypothetical protein